MADEKKKTPAKKQTPAVPSRGTEVTLVAEFPRPKEWLGRGTPAGNAKEIAVIKSKKWHPTTDDFLVVANVPNTGKQRTDIFRVNNVGEMLGAILDLGPNGEPRRKKRSILRLNIVSHGIAQPTKPTLCGLGGTIEADGTCLIRLSVSERRAGPNGPNQGGLDESVLGWLNSTNIANRNACRERFREDGSIALILCNGGGLENSFTSQQFATELANTFAVRVLGFLQEIMYFNSFDEAKSRFVDRDLTRVGTIDLETADRSQFGEGYPCALPVPEKLAGKHLVFNVDKKPKPTP